MSKSSVVTFATCSFAIQHLLRLNARESYLERTLRKRQATGAKKNETEWSYGDRERD